MIFILILGLILILRNIKRCFKQVLPSYKRYLLLTAHADDETMFFAPTLLSLRDRLKVLCLSNNNYDNMGEIRNKEIMSLSNAYIFETTVAGFEDNGDWLDDEISNTLADFQQTYNFDCIITFDTGGVSFHKNHIACYKGAKKFSESSGIDILSLKTKNLFQKYIIDLSQYKYGIVLSFKRYICPLQMMSFYPSQLKWFRRIYLITSNYMKYNDFLLLKKN